METAQHLHKLRMQIAHAALENSPFALGLDRRFHFPPRLVYHLFNMRGMDTPVGNQLFQRHAGDLPPDRFKAGDCDRLRRVVDDQIHAGQHFNRTNVASFPAYDAAFHLVIGQGNHTDGHFSHLIRGTALNGLCDNLSGPLLALLLHARFHFFDFHVTSAST